MFRNFMSGMAIVVFLSVCGVAPALPVEESAQAPISANEVTPIAWVKLRGNPIFWDIAWFRPWTQVAMVDEYLLRHGREREPSCEIARSFGYKVVATKQSIRRR